MTYFLTGSVFMIIIPAKIFTAVEGWSLLDAIYFIIISLTTIGFGDLLPRNDPPMSVATHRRNETACLFELINPVPSKNVNNETGLSNICNPVCIFRYSMYRLDIHLFKNQWPGMIQAYYSIYRMAVFFWILVGLTWVGGVISMLTENLHMSRNDIPPVKMSMLVFSKWKILQRVTQGFEMNNVRKPQNTNRNTPNSRSLNNGYRDNRKEDSSNQFSLI